VRIDSAFSTIEVARLGRDEMKKTNEGGLTKQSDRLSHDHRLLGTWRGQAIQNLAGLRGGLFLDRRLGLA